MATRGNFNLKMTLTIGGVAVLVSSVIAVLVGCVAGYFGGWVDMLLMRITEICSSIPFLPFAMMLSYVIRTKPISETTRIIIIMFMLGLLSWTGLARMIRGQVLAEREKEFVIAAQVYFMGIISILNDMHGGHDLTKPSGESSGKCK